MAEEPRDRNEQKTYAAEGVRQGAIVLRSRQRRAIFIAGLVGIVLLVLVLGLAV